MYKQRLNLRDLGASVGDIVPRGLFLRSGKLSVLSAEECARLCRNYRISCVIDLRTAVEAEEFPDPLPPEIEYLPMPLLGGAAVGITHETGSDPMAVLRKMKSQPEKLKEMIPDFKDLYRRIVTEEHSRQQLDKVVGTLRENARQGRCTLFHCTAGKDRTGIVSMALLRSYGVSDEAIIRDYLFTNRYAFLPTLKKALAVALITRNWFLVKTAYNGFMAHREHIEIAMNNFTPV